MFRRVLLVLALLVLIASPIYSLPPEPRITQFGGGSALAIATANAGSALNVGVEGGIENPASLLTNKNEILGEGEAWGAFTTKNGTSPSEMRLGAGTIGYLSKLDNSVFALYYRPQQRMQAGAVYGVNEVISRIQFVEYAASLAIRVGSNSAFGFEVAMIQGNSQSGVIVNEQGGDTLFAAHLWDAKLGFRGVAGDLNWSLVMISPSMGAIDLEKPVNITNRRYAETLSYRGAWGISGGIGKKLDGVSYAVDVDLLNWGFRKLGDESLPGNDWILESGASIRWQATEQVLVTAGLSARLIDPDTELGNYITFGVGGGYLLSRAVTLTGGAGLLLPVGSGSDGYPVDDARPWIVRGGLNFHGE